MLTHFTSLSGWRFKPRADLHTLRDAEAAVDQHMVAQYTDMLLQTSPFSRQPIWRSARNPSGDQPDTPAAISQIEDARGHISWMMHMMADTMPSAHADRAPRCADT